MNEAELISAIQPHYDSFKNHYAGTGGEPDFEEVFLDSPGSHLLQEPGKNFPLPIEKLYAAALLMSIPYGEKENAAYREVAVLAVARAVMCIYFPGQLGSPAFLGARLEQEVCPEVV